MVTLIKKHSLFFIIFSYTLLGLRPYMSFFLCLLDGDGALDGGTAAGVWLSVTDLQPYTSYSFWIRGCNTQGCIESLPLSVTTLPAGTHTPNTFLPLLIWSLLELHNVFTVSQFQISWSSIKRKHCKALKVYLSNRCSSLLQFTSFLSKLIVPACS